jgi:osmotically inducible protein OsmC
LIRQQIESKGLQGGQGVFQQPVRPTELDVEAAVTIEPEGEGFRISQSALTLRAQVPNLDQAAFARMVSVAEKNCPVSKVLNAVITVDATLIST